MSIYKGKELIAGCTSQGPRGYTGKDAVILRQVLSLPDTSLDRDYHVPKDAMSRIAVAGDTFVGFADTQDTAHSYAITGLVTVVGDTDYTLRVLALTRDITGETGKQGEKGDTGLPALGMTKKVIADIDFAFDLFVKDPSMTDLHVNLHPDSGLTRTPVVGDSLIIPWAPSTEQYKGSYLFLLECTSVSLNEITQEMVYGFLFKAYYDIKGITPAISVTASVGNEVGTPEVIVQQSGPAEAPTLQFEFKNLKGEPGSNGIGALSKGLFQLVVDPNGDLYAEYNDVDGGEPPRFEYDEETGDLYYIIGED